MTGKSVLYSLHSCLGLESDPLRIVSTGEAIHSSLIQPMGVAEGECTGISFPSRHLIKSMNKFNLYQVWQLPGFDRCPKKYFFATPTPSLI